MNSNISVRSGFVLLEALLAIGILAFFLTAVSGLVFVANVGSERVHQSELAIWAAEEGLEALQSLDFSSLLNTNTGSISFLNNHWQLNTNGPQSLGNAITRTVRVLAVNRDASCVVVASGGSVDSDSKTLESSVAWTDILGRSHQIILDALRTQWENPQGSCFNPQQAGQVAIDFLTNGQWFGGKQLREVFVTNNGASAVTIDHVVFTWDNDEEIQQSFFNSTKVWSASGPGSPSNEQHSGTDLNIQNFTLSAGQTIELNKTQFSGAMSGTTITIKLIFTDGSSITTPPFVPSG